MSLLAPLFLLALGLLTIPIWLHRLQTDDPVKESFSSTMFLEPTQKRVRVRKQLQHLLLMLLRLLFITLLVFAFARPVMFNLNLAPEVSTNQMHILVMDRTVSVSAPGVLNELQNQMVTVLDEMQQGDAAQLYVFGPTLEAATEISLDKTELIRKAGDLQTGDARGNFGDLMSGLSRLDWSEPYEYRVHIFSDFQQSALPDRYADMIPQYPSNTKVSFDFYGAKSDVDANLAIERVREEDDGLRINVRSWNSDLREISVDIKVGDGLTSTGVVEMTEAGRGTLFFADLEYEAGINQVRVSLDVRDQIQADNHFHLVVDRSPPEPVLLLTDNPFAPAAKYLSAVMSSLGRGASYGAEYRAETVSLSEFDSRTLERYSWVLIDDLGSIDDVLASAIHAYLSSGGAVFAALGESAFASEDLPVSGHEVLPETVSEDNRFQSITQVARAQELVNGLEGWSEIRVSRALNLSLQADDRVLASLDSGVPLLLERQVDQGKLILFTSSLDNQWNNLPVKPLYVSLMARMADYISNAGSIHSQRFAGEIFSMGDLAGGSGQLVDPLGNAVLDLGATRSLSAEVLDKIGFYQLFSAMGENSIGVNVDPSESDTTQMDQQQLDRWQQGLAGQSGVETLGPTGPAASVDNASRQDFWMMLLVAAGLILLLETFLANWKLVAQPAH